MLAKKKIEQGISQENDVEYRPSSAQQERFEILKTLVNAFETANVGYSIFGGYGLDALYGKLTRDHDDLDIIVDDDSLERAHSIIYSLGFIHKKTEEGVERHFHPPTKTKLDFANSGRLDQISRYLGPGSHLDESLFLPKEINAMLNGVPLRVVTLEAQKIIAAVQQKRHGNIEERQSQND